MNYGKILAGILAAGLLSLCGCGTVEERDRNQAVKIGVVLPLTGSYQAYGKAMLKGVRCAQAALSMKDGASCLPEVLIGDNRGLPGDTHLAAQSMIAQGAAILIVGYSSSEALAVKSLAQKARIPVITPGGTNDRITENNPYMFRVSFSDRLQARAAASYIRHHRRMSRLGVMLDLDENAVYSRDLGRQTAQAFTDFGGTVTAIAGFRESDKDFSPQVRELLKEYPDAVFVPAYAECAARIIRALRQNGFKGLIMGGDAWNNPTLLKNCGDPGDAAFSGIYASDAPGVKESGFYRLFEQQNQCPPTEDEVLGFDALMLAASVSRGTANSAEVLQNFTRLQAFDGAGGPLALNQEGDVLRPACITRLIYQAPGPAKFRFETIIRPEKGKPGLNSTQKGASIWNM